MEERKTKKQMLALNTGQELLKAAFKQDDASRNSPGSQIKD